jgi:heptosyltransferase-2
MTPPRNILVFQTAFIGDVVLTLPLLQVLREQFPDASITALTTPTAAGLLGGHPAVTRSIEYDKRGKLRGPGGMATMITMLRKEKFDTALIPHRSLRSALVCRAADIPVRIGFKTALGRRLMTKTVPYIAADHEIVRNLSLAKPLGVHPDNRPLPRLYPSETDRQAVNDVLGKEKGGEKKGRKVIAIAPGSVWNTKRWPEENYIELVRLLTKEGCAIILVGGEADRELSGRIVSAPGISSVIDATGKLSLLQSAELLGRCAALVSNDSAPMHLAVAMRTPVVAIFGATVPSFGFAPMGRLDRIVETNGLRCRPCGKHGGKRCPVGTFECMQAISSVRVRNEVLSITGMIR